MDLLVGSIIVLGVGVGASCVAVGFKKAKENKNKFLNFLGGKNSRRWNELGLHEFKIKDTNRDENIVVLKVKIPIGKSVDDIKKHKGIIEKAYECVCEIEDIRYSKYVEVRLISKEG